MAPGDFLFPLAKETAYCLQALSIWQEKTGKVPKGVIKRGLSWLIKE